MPKATTSSSPYWPAVKTGLGGRLKQARELLGHGQRQFAGIIEIPLPSIKDYEGGKSIPGGEALARYAMLGFNLRWLLRDEGDPLVEVARSGSAVHRVEQPRAGYVYLPLYEVHASAGCGAIIETEQVVDLLAFKEDWLRQELNAGPGDVALLFVTGRSMEPDLRAGDVIMIDRRDTTAQREAIYVIRMDGAVLVKELQRLPGGIIKVRSKNPDYEPFERTITDLEARSDFAVIGRVVWACRRF